jgi:hypothetical protein
MDGIEQALTASLADRVNPRLKRCSAANCPTAVLS